MKKINALLLAILSYAAVMDVSAQDAKPSAWSDEAELSYVSTGGNSDTKAYAARNMLKYAFSEKVDSQWKLGMLEIRTDGKKTAENYYTELRGDYKLTEGFYAMLGGGWMRDEFAGIENRYYVGPGGGYQFIEGPAHFFKSEAGVDYVREEYTNDSDTDFMRGRLFAEYNYHFAEKNKLLQTVEYLRDFEDSMNYNVNTETALISALNGSLSLKTSYLVKYDNEPVPHTLKRTDTFFTVALVVNIK